MCIVTKYMCQYERDDIELYKALGYRIVEVSAEEGDVSELIPLLKGKVTAFIGPSGVGKSSLVNLITGSNQRVGEVSDKYNRGKHTTNHALWISKDDIDIIDTPGIREILPPLEDLTELRASFPELRGLSCKYADCLHDGEDGCIVPALVEEGRIDEGRYSGYLTMLHDLKDVHLRIVRNKW